MKTKLRILIPLLLFAIPCIPQDIIIEKDGTRVCANILEYNKHEIRYKLCENLDGALHILSTNYVAKVIYDSTVRKPDSLEVASYPKGANPLLVPPVEAYEFYKQDPMSINFNRHGIELNVTDFIFAGMLTMSYEHISPSGLFSFSIPISIGLKSADLNPGSVGEPPYNYYNPYKNYTIGLNLNLYPTGQGRFKYYLGLSFEFGVYSCYNSIYHSTYDSATYSFNTTVNTVKNNCSYVAILFQNGLLLQLSKSLDMSFNVGLGWTQNTFYAIDYDNIYIGGINNNISPSPGKVTIDGVAARASICIGYKF